MTNGVEESTTGKTVAIPSFESIVEVGEGRPEEGEEEQLSLVIPRGQAHLTEEGMITLHRLIARLECITTGVVCDVDVALVKTKQRQRVTELLNHLLHHFLRVARLEEKEPRRRGTMG
jgi:hypothetical protein